MDRNIRNMIIKESMEIDARVELFTRQFAGIMRFACILGEQGASLLNFIRLLTPEEALIPRDALLPMMRDLRPITRMHYASYLVETGFLDELPDTYALTDAMLQFRLILLSPLMEGIVSPRVAEPDRLSDISESASDGSSAAEPSASDAEIDAEIDRLFFRK